MNIIFYIFSSLTTIFIITSVNNIGNKLYEKNGKPLPDLLHLFFKNYYIKYNIIPDIILILICIIGIININDLTGILDRFFILHLIRNVAISLTIIPPPNRNTRTPISFSNYDIIISGHTFSAVLVCLYTQIYMCYFLTFIMCLTIVLTREHYSVDIWLGYVLAILIFNCNIHLNFNLFID